MGIRMLNLLAHGALGPWDEIIFLGVSAVFIVIMGISWVRSRNAEFDEDDPDSLAPTSTPDGNESPERFRLD